MNTRDPNFSLPDIQSEPDLRELRIEAVGIKGVRYPMTIGAGAAGQATVASFSMTVGLAAQVKGTHMSRFIELLEAQARPLDQAGFIAIAERSASCEVFGLLKRADEKYVTERAYDNPKFVEDLVRDVALALEREPRVLGNTVEAENFESIHNHSAFARIAKPAAVAPKGEDAP
jgi:GTP cyclohydrolase FolE2